MIKIIIDSVILYLKLLGPILLLVFALLLATLLAIKIYRLHQGEE